MTTCAICGTVNVDGASACSACGVAIEGARTIVSTVTPPRAQPPAPAPPPASAFDDLLERVRRDLGRDYEVVSELGRGGMAVVYKAIELELLRPVALKVLPPELAASTAMAERFRREARMAASFDHPNIIPIYRVGQAGGVFYIAMKYIEGRPLDAIIESQGALPIPVVLHVLRAATRALAFAHNNNVVHRDIKGANILIDQDGRVVVSDFGIARAGEDANLTATGSLMGTPYFMSPEQCAGHRVGQQSDQYSLGIVAFQMLTGTVPFRAETIPGVMQHHFFTPVPEIGAVRTDVPPALVEVVNRALAKRPSDRYASTRDMQLAVDAISFPEKERQNGEALLRDLVLGVQVPRVDAGVLPPLAETLLMTPPPVAREREAQARRRFKRRTVTIATAGALAMSVLGYVVATRFVAAPAAAAEDGPTAPTPAEVSPTPATAAVPADSPAPDVAPDTSVAEPRTVAKAPRDTAAATAFVATPVAPPVAEAAPGKLRVRAFPSDAEILVDGRLLGRGIVVDSTVAAGERRLRLVAPGYATLDTVVVVRPGETSQVGTLRMVPAEGRP